MMEMNSACVEKGSKAYVQIFNRGLATFINVKPSM